MKKIWWRYSVENEIKRNNIDNLCIEVEIDSQIVKLEKMKSLLIEIKSLADDIFNKQERS